MFIKTDQCLGVGVNFRNEIGNDIIHHINEIDFIEVNTERFFVDKNNLHLDKILKKIPLVLHGLTLSVGADQPIEQTYLDNLSSTLSSVNCAWFSEHISMTSINGIEVRALMPVSFNEDSIERIVNKTKTIMSKTDKNFLLENITYYYSMPNSKMNEAAFITEVIERSDCGMLLDVNNLYVNSINHHYDPYDFLEQIPKERIVEVHLAGCDYRYDMLVDTHASQIKKEVLELFKYLCSNADIKGVVIERDSNLDSFSDLIDEVRLVRDILKKNSRARN